jgi:cell division protein FtsI/penicillin-binding protein 2
MGSMNIFYRSSAAGLLVACLIPIASPGVARAGAFESSTSAGAALFSSTASERLARDFSSADISYLLFDSRNDRFIAAKWIESKEPISVGSLVKPFTALAYAETHEFRFPEHVCSGGNSCWLTKGHGTMGIVRAISLSCNAYFAELASHTGAQVTLVAQRYGLNGPGVNASNEAMAGQFGIWRESPEALVRAYATLLRRRSQPGVRDIVDGMAESATTGTAAGLSRQGLHQQFLAKTGTAPCTHKTHAPGDGFVIVAWPVDFPRYVLMVRQHGVPGARTSVLAGRMLRSLEP